MLYIAVQTYFCILYAYIFVCVVMSGFIFWAIIYMLECLLCWLFAMYQIAPRGHCRYLNPIQSMLKSTQRFIKKKRKKSSNEGAGLLSSNNPASKRMEEHLTPKRSSHWSPHFLTFADSCYAKVNFTNMLLLSKSKRGNIFFEMIKMSQFQHLMCSLYF